MTPLLLAAAWAGLAFVGAPPIARTMGALRPRLQALTFFLATFGLVLLPVSMITVVLARNLSYLGSEGSALTRCGRLIAAVTAEPLAHPEVTAALFLLAAGAIALPLGALSAWRSQSSVRRLVHKERGRRIVVKSPAAFAFTTGFLTPRVVVSDGLLQSNPQEWCRVVLAHEEAHRRGRHPLLVLAVESLARTLPLPPLRWAADGFRLALEEIADEYASCQVGDHALVAEAVAAIALKQAGHALGFEGREAMRCRRLLARPAASHLFAGLIVVAGLLAVVAFAGGHALHCGRSAFETLQVVQCRLV